MPIHATPRIYRYSYFVLQWMLSRYQNEQSFGTDLTKRYPFAGISSKEIPVRMVATQLHKLTPQPQTLPLFLISKYIVTQGKQKQAQKEGYPVKCIDCIRYQ